ncbi:hypothetical protein LDG_8144 [Legionella drancourtii LLAP12]|uniref:Uncharacterized protein n=1 Tax=Legionella drancourtii LLAP12 TaxID=658187 RepID=G9ES71_9GAMM|nr:hypothetical protein LDG_8144 [Legionella drancourtii LLAP12]
MNQIYKQEANDSHLLIKIKKIRKIIAFKVDIDTKHLQNTQHIAGMKAFIN